MKRSTTTYTITLLIMLFGYVNPVNSQVIISPSFLGSISSNGSHDPFTGVLLAHDSNNRVYVGSYNEVVMYDPTLPEMVRVAGTGENGTIVEGIATEVPMMIQSIAVGPQDQLHILSEGYIGRLNPDGIIELLEFETESGENTHRIPTLETNTPVSDIIFNESGELFILTFNGSDVGDVIYKVDDKKLIPFVGGGTISLLDGNIDNPHRLDVRIDVNDFTKIKAWGDTLFFCINSGNDDYVYKINSSGNVEFVYDLGVPIFAPVIDNNLLFLESKRTTVTTNANVPSRLSVSLYAPELDNTKYLTDVPLIYGSAPSNSLYALGYNQYQSISYIAVKHEFDYALWAIPEMQSYTTTNINDWNYHE